MPGLNTDFYNLGLLFLTISSTVGATNFIVTIFKLRAPGMSLNRMPLFVLWSILATSFSLIFALPALSAANIELELQRKLGHALLRGVEGGDPLLWQHLFWIFGHPDVYIILLPALGIASQVIADVLASADRRAQLARALDDDDRVYRLRRVGAPHVRDRAAAADADLLLRRVDDRRHPERDPDLRLVRDADQGNA